MIEILSHINIDLQLNNIEQTHKLLPILKRADDLFLKFNITRSYELNKIINGKLTTFEIVVNKDKILKIESNFFNDNCVRFHRTLLDINYEYPYYENNSCIRLDYMILSPIHNIFTMYGNDNFIVQKPYIHDEAWYFQKSTQFDLPDERLYIAGTELMNAFSSLECNFKDVFIPMGMSDNDLEIISELLDLMENVNAEHN